MNTGTFEMFALETSGLGKRYGRTWALQDCTLSLPTGKIAGLVGPNGAGKTTLLHLAIGLLAPTNGSLKVLGFSPQDQLACILPRVGFVGQDRPLYRSFTVQEMLTFGQKLNAGWDEALAKHRLEQLGLPLQRPIGKLSGGQQAQVALVLALAKRPDLLLLDEPVASLDPLARRSFFQTLMDAVAESGLTVLFSSHQVADLERVCDSLIILAGGRVQLSGEIEHLLAEHHWIACPPVQQRAVEKIGRVLQILPSGHSQKLLVRAVSYDPAPNWDVQAVSLEDMVLAYLTQPVEAQSTVSLHVPEWEVSQ